MGRCVYTRGGPTEYRRESRDSVRGVGGLFGFRWTHGQVSKRDVFSYREKKVTRFEKEVHRQTDLVELFSLCSLRAVDLKFKIVEYTSSSIYLDS